MAKDPVCNMEVNEKKPAATSFYKNKTYYFCAVGCKKSFDANPEKYLGKEKSSSHQVLKVVDKTGE